MTMVMFVGAEVRSIDFAELLKSGVLHTKLWIVDGIHAYVGSANMDYRSLTQVSTESLLTYPFTRGVARILHWGGPRKLSAEGARIEAPKVPSGVGKGEGVSPPQPTRGSGGAS